MPDLASRIEVEQDRIPLFTGTLLKDLYAAVERAEARAEDKSEKVPEKSSDAGAEKSFEARVEEWTEQAAAIRSGKSLSHAFTHTENPAVEPSCCSEAEKLAQALGLGTADWNLALLLIVHAQLIRTLEPGNNFANSIDVHQVGAVSPPEQSRIQTGE
jgi:hypothetical protein